MKPEYIIIWLAVMSTALFITMGADKRRARRGARRVPERRLFALTLIGGAFGGWAGMYAFHHKTRHWYFKFGIPAILLAQIALGVFVYVRFFAA